MKKIILSTLSLISISLASQLTNIPINNNLLSDENGGFKKAIDAYSDGIGVLTAGKLNIDNSPMNILVYKYGDSASKNNKTLKEYVLENGTIDDKKMAEKLGKISKAEIPKNGEACDDKNSSTFNDMFLNGVCIGQEIPEVTFDLLFRNGNSIGGGQIDFDNKKIMGYRVLGTSPVGYNSIDMQQVYDMGIRELKIKFDNAGGCGLGYFGQKGNVDHADYNSTLYNASNVIVHIDLETKIVEVKGGSIDARWPRVRDMSHLSLDNFVIGAASIQSGTCWQSWDF